MHKTNLKSFVLKIFFIGDDGSTFLSLVTKFEVYNVYKLSKLDHFENDIHFCRGV